MTNHLDFIFGPLVLGLVFLLLGWPFARLMRGGRALNGVQRKMLLYGFLFVLGMGYSMALGALLHWQGSSSIALTLAWVMILAFAAWTRSRRKNNVSRRH